MISAISLPAAIALLVAVAVLGGSRIVVGELTAGDAGAAPAPRPRRLQLIDRGLALASVLLLVALTGYLVAGVT